jgi:3-deoxy-7-phosphoheptulonate synthase
MTSNAIDDLNVVSQELLISPAEIKKNLPLSAKALAAVTEGRDTVRNILDRKDHRIFIVIGPCSIHDVDAAMDYAARLK